MNKAIAPTLEKMKVGQMESWPVERDDTVRNSVYRHQRKHRRDGWKYSIKVSGLEIQVTRIA